MPRWRLTVEYDGAPFVGWQRQPGGASVQEALERAVHAFCAETIEVTAAGRTDAGVHATGQVVHLDLVRAAPAHTVAAALNAHLRPLPVAVLDATPVAETFHARFDAIRRRYRYVILTRRAPPVLERGRVWHVPRMLDVDAMAEAAASLVGRHDFTTFRAVACQAHSPVKTLERLAVTAASEHVVIEAEARSFLHHQVRNLVGTLKLVGEGRWPVQRVAEALAARDRRAGGPTAPPQGLCLTGVDYPD